MTRDPIRLLDDPAVDQDLKGFLQEERTAEALPPSVRQGVERRIAGTFLVLPGLVPTLPPAGGGMGGAGGAAGGASGAAGSGSAAAGTSSGVAGATTSAGAVSGGGSAAVGATGAVAGTTGAAASSTLGGLFAGGAAAAKIAGVASLLVGMGVGTAYVAGELGQTKASHTAPGQVDGKHEASQPTTGSAEATSFDAAAVERPPQEEDIPSLSLEDLPDEPLQIEPAAPAAPGKGGSVDEARRAALTAEVSLLRRARSALQSDREAARRILQQYDAEFPSGVLRAEYAALLERAHQD